MLVVTAKVKVQAGKQQDFIEGTKGLIDGTRAEAGNISYNLYTQVGDDTNFIFVEEWKSDADLNLHMEMPHFVSFVKLLEAIGDGAPDIVVYEATKKG